MLHLDSCRDEFAFGLKKFYVNFKVVPLPRTKYRGRAKSSFPICSFHVPFKFSTPYLIVSLGRGHSSAIIERE